jgi:predicted metal-dependent hydrolase
MQLVLPWSAPSRRTAASPPVLQVGETTYPVTITRHRRARRFVLRMAAGGELRLTVPRGASIESGLAFARSQEEWIGRERARRAERDGPWRSGTLVWFRGEQLRLTVEDATVSFGAESVALPFAESNIREVCQRRMRHLASEDLPVRCLELARQHGLDVSRVSVRNQRSRWGSCSARATIALNWRLIQMPSSVSDYIILHELMHLRQPNHSRQFWREVSAVCAGWREAERWLRAHGAQLL